MFIFHPKGVQGEEATFLFPVEQRVCTWHKEGKVHGEVDKRGQKNLLFQPNT